MDCILIGTWILVIFFFSLCCRLNRILTIFSGWSASSCCTGETTGQYILDRRSILSLLLLPCSRGREFCIFWSESQFHSAQLLSGTLGGATTLSSFTACLLLSLRGNWTWEQCGDCNIFTHIQVFSNLSIWSEPSAWKDPCFATEFYITCSSGNFGSIGMVILCEVTLRAEYFCCHLWGLFNGLLNCTLRL